jgi:N-methylhydantoinase A
MRFAVDTGGTFTDLAVEEPGGRLHIFKAATTPDDPTCGVLDVFETAARALGLDRAELLGRAETLIYGTTRAINAILTGRTARTAFLTTAGHRDILLFREGGRSDTFDWTRPYPEPYVPRSLTFEVPERIGAEGDVVLPLDEAAVVEIAGELAAAKVEAVAVCLLWSIVNPLHELRVGELLSEHLPEVPYTLSQALNPTLREYRRASSAAIDASLKPIMSAYLHDFEARLRGAGFGGRVLVVTSSGTVMDAAAVAAAPIHSVGSGPAMAPVAGRYFADSDGAATTAIVADTGGTSYDVSVVRRGLIPTTRETWLGPQFLGHMTGFPSVDVKSIGAGGGSIAWVDDGGLLHVGPESAGAVPGPVCYGRGGARATLTDASLVLGYLDPDYFLGGAIRLDVEAARTALSAQIAEPLGIDVTEAAAAVVDLATEHMARAIEEITVNQGIDPRAAVLIGGGGAAGLNAVAIARRLRCPRVVIPEVGPVLSAVGALMSDLGAEFGATHPTRSVDFDSAGVNAILAGLLERCETFARGPGAGATEVAIDLFAEARYPQQNWELEVPLRVSSFADGDVEQLRQDFHARHEEVFAISDPQSFIELVGWRARVSCRLDNGEGRRLAVTAEDDRRARTRRTYFPDCGFVDAQIVAIGQIEPGATVTGPAVIESPLTTVVLPPGASAVRQEGGSLAVLPRDDEAATGSASSRMSPAAGVSLAVTANRLEGVVRAMMNTLFRTGRSCVLNTSRDFSCCIVTSDDELLASAESLPVHVMRGPDLMAAVMKELHPDFGRGDAFLNNSPYHGNSHAADHSILIPVIDDDGVHRFTVVAKAHQADCGNALPTTYAASARDVYEEGALIFPCVRVQAAYVDVADVIRMCKLRIRVPEQWWGDYLALLGAARIGERLLLELGAELGWEALREFSRRWFDYSEQRLSAAIRTLESARFTATSAHDPFPGVPDGIPVKATVAIDSEQARIEIDLRDNPDCLPCGLNLTEATAYSAALIGVFNSIGRGVPVNAGSYRRLRVLLRENCVAGIPRHPASCSLATTNVSDRLINAVQRTMAELRDGIGMAEMGLPTPPSCGVISGRDPRTGALFVNQLILSALTGGAGTPSTDGWLATGLPATAGVLSRDSVEVDELRHPIRVLAQYILPDTEGAGRFRGSPGAYAEYGPVGCAIDVMYHSDASVNPPLGARGGLPGAPARQYKRTANGSLVDIDVAGLVTLEAGETIVSISCGGGGYGPPTERDPARVEHDVREGWVTRARAEAVYGVALTGQLDHKLTPRP